MDLARNSNDSYALLLEKNHSNVSRYINNTQDFNDIKSMKLLEKCDKLLSETIAIENNFFFGYNHQWLLSLSILVGIVLHWKFVTQKKLKSKKFLLRRPFKDYRSVLKEFYENNADYAKTIFTAGCFFLFILLLPVFFSLWIFMLIYRECVFYNIKKKYSEIFCGFLEGTDALWALEDESARSVINIMALIKIDRNAENAPKNVLLTLRKRLASRFLGVYKPFPKLFYRLRQEHGYAFWTNDLDLTIEDYIRFLPDLVVTDKCTDDKTCIESLFSVLSNQPLPCDHSALWEILVSKHLIKDQPSDDDGEFYDHIPVLLRIHHAVGDGVALLRLFLETIADREQPKKHLWAYCSRKRVDLKKYLTTDSDALHPIDDEGETPMWKKMFHINYFNFRQIRVYMLLFLQKLRIILTSPAAIVHQSVFQQIDKNSLHKPKLSGEKHLCWRFEMEDDNELLDTMKIIKRTYLGVRFSDVLLSALSISLQNYFESKDKYIPNTMTVVLPARIAIEEAKLQLQNKFSVALQTLPIRARTRLRNRSARFHSKMLEVKKYSDELRKSPDYYVNYWIMSFLTALLPAHVLGPLVESVHSTVAVSNLPGPQTVAYISGYRINNLVFWLPHRGSTGIGISILSYGHKLHLGLIADRNAMANRRDAQIILDNTVKEIKEMALIRKQKTKRCSVGDIMNMY